jgi:hypothetical protein
MGPKTTAPDKPPKAASPTRSPASAADDMHETAITTAATIFFMLCFLLPSALKVGA